MNSNTCAATALTTFSLLLFLQVPAPAIEIGWHDDMTIWLGDGIKLNQQDVPAFPGLVELAAAGIYAKNGWQDEIVTFAQNNHDMVKTLNINSSVSVNSLFASGSSSMDFFLKQTFSDNDLKFVFTKTRNFGTTLFSPVGFYPAFTNQAGIFQKTLQGEALHARITGTFGTHYVRGYEESAFVFVLYTFHYASATIKQRLSVSASGSALDAANFSSFVTSFFGSTNTAVSMSYQLYSSSYNPLPGYLNGSGVITNYASFTNFVGKLETYVNSMTYADSKIAGYILDPIQSVPGYLSLLGGYVPPALGYQYVSSGVECDDASDFLRVYSALQVWSQRLGSSAATMSWLNAQGQQVVQSKALDVANYLGAMRSIGSNHYATGAPLYPPADAVTYLANLSDITLPEIYAMDSFDYSVYNAVCNCFLNYHCLIGRVDCGDRGLLKQIPFNAVSLLHYQTNSGSLTNIDYDPPDFEATMLNAYKSGTIHEHLLNLFTNAQWACLTNPVASPDLNGFFLVTQRYDNSKPGDAQNWSVAIRDDRGTNTDVMAFLETRSGGCGAPDQFSSVVSVSASMAPGASTSVIGRAQPVTLQVTNQDSVQSFGTTVSFVLDHAFDFGGANGSQGYASFNSSNRVVTCSFGPMLAGATATMTLQVIPLQTNATPSAVASLSLGAGLINSASNTNVFFAAIESTSPVLEAVRAPGGLLLDWWSDTDRLQVEGSSTFGSGSVWSPVTSAVIMNSSHRFLWSPAAQRNYFFRLHGR